MLLKFLLILDIFNKVLINHIWYECVFRKLVHVIFFEIFSRLGNFVKLVDQLIVEHMFDVSKTQVITFVESVLSNQKDSREGLFRANLVFTKQGKINCKSISIYFCC